MAGFRPAFAGRIGHGGLIGWGPTKRGMKLAGPREEPGDRCAWWVRVGGSKSKLP